MRKFTKYLLAMTAGALLLTSGCGLFKDDKHPATTSTVKSVPAPTGSKGQADKHNLTLTPKSGDLKGISRKEATPRCSPGYDTLELSMGREVWYGNKMSFIASMKGADFVIDYRGGTAAKVVAVIINDDTVLGVISGNGDPSNTSGSFIASAKALKGAKVSSAVLCINVDA